MAIDSRTLRNALGCYPTGVTIVTIAPPEGPPIGMTMNSFTSISLNPPLLLISLDRKASAFAEYMAASHVVVNVLSAGQKDLSTRFATPGNRQMTDIAFETWDTGCPVLPDSISVFECTVHERSDAGDHVNFLLHVDRMVCNAEGDPLVYFRGKYAAVHV